MIDQEKPEGFTRSVEERHFNEDRASRLSAENSAQTIRFAGQTIADEEFEAHEDHPDFKEERCFSLSYVAARESLMCVIIKMMTF